MNLPNGIKAIFFDLDGTLRQSVPSADEIMNEFLRGQGVNINQHDHLLGMRWEYSYWADSPDLREDIIAHSMDTDKFWVEYTKRRLLALKLSMEQSTELAPKVSLHMAEMYKPESIVPEDVQRVLPKLKQAGYMMAVISNRDKPFRKRWIRTASANSSTFRWRAVKWIFTNLIPASLNMHSGVPTYEHARRST